MRKSLITTAIILSSILLAQAQQALTEFGLFEDFSTVDEYTSDVTLGRGLYWWTSPNYSIQRDAENKQLIVNATQAKWEHIPFGIAFGDSNGAATGGEPYTVDLSGNGKWSFDITNTGTEEIAVYVQAVDNLDRAVDCSPGAIYFSAIWQYQTQIFVAPGATVTFEAGTPNGAGGNRTNDCDFTTGVWGDYGTHTIRTDCDLKHIKGINITVLAGEKDPVDLHAVPLLDGKFTISNFIVGDTSANAITAPIPSIDFPEDNITVIEDRNTKIINYTSVGNWTATSSDSWLTVQVYNTETGEDSLKLSSKLNSTTQTRTATVTLASKYGTPQTFTVTQNANTATQIEDINDGSYYYKIQDNSIICFISDIKIYTIMGTNIPTAGNSAIHLLPGIYFIQTPLNTQKILIK